MGGVASRTGGSRGWGGLSCLGMAGLWRLATLRHGPRRGNVRPPVQDDLDRPAADPHIDAQRASEVFMAKDIKRVALGIGLTLLIVWLVLFVLHVLLALVWVFFWIGFIGILLAVVLHAIERFV